MIGKCPTCGCNLTENIDLRAQLAEAKACEKEAYLRLGEVEKERDALKIAEGYVSGALFARVEKERDELRASLAETKNDAERWRMFHIDCTCGAAKLHPKPYESELSRLLALASALKSVLSEEGVKEYLSAYVMGVETIDRLTAWESSRE